jgi:putative transposase
VYAVIEQLTLPGTFPVAIVCDTLQVSRAGYYAWRCDAESARAQRDRELLPLVRDIFWRHKRRYGARRIAVELVARGQPCGVDRVAKLLKIQGLRAIQPKSFVPKTTDSRHTLGYSPNLLLNALAPTRINQVWVADITYLPLRSQGFAYLALAMDLFSRRVLGWDLAAQMTETLVLETLRQAIRLRQPGPRLIHHSDRGGQYAGRQYRAVLRRSLNGTRRSTT